MDSNAEVIIYETEQPRRVTSSFDWHMLMLMSKTSLRCLVIIRYLRLATTALCRTTWTIRRAFRQERDAMFPWFVLLFCPSFLEVNMQFRRTSGHQIRLSTAFQYHALARMSHRVGKESVRGARYVTMSSGLLSDLTHGSVTFWARRTTPGRTSYVAHSRGITNSAGSERIS